MTADGRPLSRYFPWCPALPGSELGRYFANPHDYKTEWWQFMGFDPNPGPTWEPTDFDFDSDYQRTGVQDAIVNGYSNPDLRNFKTAGGKLMIIQGWEDEGLPGPTVTVDYYEMLERILGSRAATQEFARLFMIPGRGHCAGGVGATNGDFLGYLEAWVERGQKPDVIIGYRPSEPEKNWPEANSVVPARYEFSRPHFPHPLQTRYKGRGDPNDHRNFEPYDPKRR